MFGEWVSAERVVSGGLFGGVGVAFPWAGLGEFPQPPSTPPNRVWWVELPVHHFCQNTYTSGKGVDHQATLDGDIL